MYTKQVLWRQLEQLGVRQEGTLMVHVSCKAIGPVQGGGDAVLDTFTNYMEPGLLVLPSHTWANVDSANPVMDVLYTPTCVGILTELFRKRRGVCRSLHPTHSLAAIGADASAFIAGEDRIQTPCGEKGAYYKLWQRNAQILLVGVNFTRNTYIHGIEEWDGVPGTDAIGEPAERTLASEPTDLYVIDAQGNRLYTPQYRHCSRLGSETFCKLEPQAIQEGILSLGRLGDATARLMSAVPLREMVARLLRQDPQYLLRY